MCCVCLVILTAILVSVRSAVLLVRSDLQMTIWNVAISVPILRAQFWTLLSAPKKEAYIWVFCSGN